MPDWSTHVKWARELGISEEIADFINKLIDAPDEVLRNDPSELGELYRREPHNVRLIITGHDWGKRSKARLSILRQYCYNRFGEKGVLAAELHHVLDYIAYIRNPENLARMIINALTQYGTRGLPMVERIMLMRSYYGSREYQLNVKKLTMELSKLNDQAYKEIITELLKVKAEEWSLHREVLEFIQANLDAILVDVDKWIKKHIRTKPVDHENRKLDEWFKT